MKLPLPEGTYAAYLFDCDGTIADSMPLHYEAWVAVLGEHGATFEEDLFYSWGGRRIADIIADLNTRQGLTMPVEAVAARQEEIFRLSLPTIAAVPEVHEHIIDGYGRYPFAVVSGSTRESVEASLAALGLRDRFDVLVCAGDYVNPKPDPECYLLAAAKLGVAPADCVVFEDTELGIQAALAAGMTAIRVPGPQQRRLAG